MAEPMTLEALKQARADIIRLVEDATEKLNEMGAGVDPAERTYRPYVDRIDKAIAELDRHQGVTVPPAPSAWMPTHQHRKGDPYRVITRAELEADLSSVVVYESAEGRVWVRPAAEFDDGRFTAITTPPVAENAHEGAEGGR